MGVEARAGDAAMEKGARYRADDLVKSYVWLGHRGFTELNAFHPDYRAGRENVGWNVEHKAFPRVWYARNPNEAVKFVERYSESRTCCYSLNPRPRIFKNDKGYPRSAVDSEITLSQNLLFDFDIETKKISQSHRQALEQFLSRADEYFADIQLRAPVRAFTGRGYHLLFAYSPIEVRKHPDLALQLRQFRNQFADAFRRELANLETRLDNTQDLRRMVRMYGTAKPRIGIISSFYGNERVEDERLRDYLLSLSLPAERPVAGRWLEPSGELPPWFHSVLEQDRQTRELWSGIGKPQSTDISSSGFDYSLVRRLLRLGHRNIDEIATILALRPLGSVRRHGKSDAYIRRTIGNAIIRGTDGEHA